MHLKIANDGQTTHLHAQLSKNDKSTGWDPIRVRPSPEINGMSTYLEPEVGYTVLIADDDQANRVRLREVAEAHPDVARVSECRTGEAAASCIRADRPDVLFLDVDAETAGLDVIEQISADDMPVTVVITRSSDFAVRAFELQAADYLVKPIDSARFAAAIDHALERVRRAGEKQISASLIAMLNDLRARAQKPSRFLVHDKGKYKFVHSKDIDWIEAADNYVVLHVGTARNLSRGAGGL